VFDASESREMGVFEHLWQMEHYVLCGKNTFFIKNERARLRMSENFCIFAAFFINEQ
jgi:hypothetical protein